MIQFPLYFIAVIAIIAAIFVGAGSSWIYLGLHLKSRVLTSRQRMFTRLGMVVVIAGIFIFAFLILSYVMVLGSGYSTYLLLFIIFSLLFVLIIAIPSFLYIRKRL